MTRDATMRAISQDIAGGPEVLQEVLIPRPVPGMSEILVAVRAAGVNPTDWQNRAYPLAVDHLPLVLGWDVSGIVEAVGIGVTIFKPGDEVFGMLPYPQGVGSHAEYVTGPARSFVRKPGGIDHIQAGALPLAALTAYQALADTADVRALQRVLIHAAAGGVGHLAVQIAKARGAYVIGTASAAKHEFVRSLGADEVIDYRTVNLAEAVTDIDVVLDTVSFDTAGRARSLAVLRPGGTLVSILPMPLDPDELAEISARGIRFESLLVEADGGSMRAIAELVEAGALRAHVAATFPLAEAAKAHVLGETGRTSGKIVLTVEGSRKTEVAERVLRAAFESGDTSVIDRFVRPDYIQHSAFAANGREALKDFGTSWRRQFPNAAYDVKRAICDGDMVFLHTHGITVPGSRGLTICDIFRFQDGMIAEHWNVVQELPKSAGNSDRMFGTVSEPHTVVPQEQWLTVFNKQRIADFVDQVLVGKNLGAVDAYVAPDYVGHHPDAPGDRTGLKSVIGGYFAQFPELSVSRKQVIAEGDLVAVLSHHVTTPAERGQAVIDVFRVRNAQIVEHWQASQDVPQNSANDNTMF